MRPYLIIQREREREDRIRDTYKIQKDDPSSSNNLPSKDDYTFFLSSEDKQT